MGDLNSFQARAYALRLAMIADGRLQGIPFHDNDLRTLLERVKAEGSSFFTVTLPLLGRAHDLGLVTGHFQCPANFARKRESCLSKFLHAVLNQVFDLEGNLLRNPLNSAVYFLRQFLLFDAKLISEPTPKQESAAITGFIDRQERLRKVSIPVDHPVLVRAKALLKDVLSTLDLSTILPGHGPGIVAEGLDREERWDFDYWPAKAERHYPFLIYGSPSMSSTILRGKGIPLRKKMVTKCCLVPKDFRGPRLISAEPTVNQYLQQGQMRRIMQYVDDHPVISLSLKMRDQTRNQRMAQRSVEDCTATLDLSDASDTVSTTLVWYLLSGVPTLRRYLMSTRSDYLSYKGKEVKIVAFAPMGSAVCFPIESLVFWALSMGSLMLARHSDRPPWSTFVRELSSSIGVFGDDIIIPEEALSILIGTLESVGCKPNMSKTCSSTVFRESCGTEWMGNTDVTIIRNRRYYYEDRRNFSNHPVLLGLQRKFFLRGLGVTAKLLLDWAREIYPVMQIPFEFYPCPSRGIRHESLPISAQKARERGFKMSPQVGYGFSSHTHHVRDNLRGLHASRVLASEIESYFERQDYAIDSFPTALGFDVDHYGLCRIRYNRELQRTEFRTIVEIQPSYSWKSEGFPRLFARLSSDYNDRLPSRHRKVKLAWSYLPFNILLSKDVIG